MKLAFVIRPSRVWISSISASPRPCAVPPSIWPSTAWGLIALPTSCAVPIQTTRVRPRSTSTSATTCIAATASATCERSPVVWPVSGSSGHVRRVVVDPLDVDLLRAGALALLERGAARELDGAGGHRRQARGRGRAGRVDHRRAGRGKRRPRRRCRAPCGRPGASRRSRPGRPRPRRSGSRRRSRAGSRGPRRSRRSPPSSRCS